MIEYPHFGLLVFFFTIACAISLVVFILQYIRQRNAHRSQIEAYRDKILANTSQRKFRQFCLSKYDFLQYNLDDALMVQHEIKLDYDSK